MQKTNLRSASKLKALIEKSANEVSITPEFRPDLAVWRGAREAIVVNASAAI